MGELLLDQTTVKVLMDNFIYMIVIPKRMSMAWTFLLNVGLAYPAAYLTSSLFCLIDMSNSTCPM